MQLQLQYTEYTTLQLQLHYATLHYNHTTPHYIQQLWRGDHRNHFNHSKKHNSNHPSVQQWILSAIHDSQQPASPIGFLFVKLPPPPCAALPVYIYTHTLYSDISHEKRVGLAGRSRLWMDGSSTCCDSVVSHAKNGRKSLRLWDGLGASVDSFDVAKSGYFWIFSLVFWGYRTVVPPYDVFQIPFGF